jgi:hypothetical protein
MYQIHRTGRKGQLSGPPILEFSNGLKRSSLIIDDCLIIVGILFLHAIILALLERVPINPVRFVGVTRPVLEAPAR